MTIAACPNGCGGFINTAVDSYCTSCRRSLFTTETIIADASPKGGSDCDPMKARKPSYCWEWFGPADHRMKCRLSQGHSGEHDTHEERSGCLIVSTEGTIISEVAPSSQKEKP